MNKRIKSISIQMTIGLAALVMLLVTPRISQAVDFTSLTSSSGSYSVGISPDGSTVLGCYGSEWESAIWSASTGWSQLGTLPGASSTMGVAYAASSDGSVVVGSAYNANGNMVAFSWTAADGMQELGNLPGAGSESWAGSVSADGSVVVGTSYNYDWSQDDYMADETAWMWTASGGAQDLGDLAGGDTWAWAYDVSADGSIAVGTSSIDGTDSDAFIWNASDGMTALGLAEGKEGMETEAFGISADGSTVVGKVETESGGWEAAMWDASGEMIVLGGLEGGGDAEAYTVSGDGSVIIGYAENAEGDITAILWTEELGLVDLVDYLLAFGIDISEWDDLYALGISDDGLTIVGYGEDPDNDMQSWMVTLDASSVPVPGAVWLLGSGLLGILGLRRRKSTSA